MRVALARYGESGRRFVVVDSTERGSACFDGVKPGDELAAVNGAAVVDPDEESIETLKSAIANAPRHAAARNNLADLLLAYACVGQARAVLAPALAALDDDDPLRPVLAATAREIEQAEPAACRLENTQEELQP